MNTHRHIFFLQLGSVMKQKHLLLFMILLFSIGGKGYTQTQTKEILQDSLNAYVHLQMAKELSKASAVKASNICAIEAADAFLKLKKWEEYYQCYYIVTNNAFRFQYYSQANYLFQKAIGKIHTFPEAKQTLGLLYHLQSAIHVPQGKYLEVIQYGEKAIRILEQFENPPNIERAYLNLANAYQRERNDFQKTIQYSNQAIEICLNQPIIDSIRIGNLYFLLGNAHKGLKRYEKAITSYKKCEDYRGGIDSQLAYLLSKNYIEKINYELAIKYAKKAIEVSINMKEEEDSDLYLQLALTYHKAGNFKQSFPYYQKAFSLAKQNLQKTNPNYIKIYIYLGDFHKSQNQLNQALQSYQTALQLLEPNFNSSNIRENPPIAENYTSIWTMEAIKNKATVFMQKFKKDSLQIDLKSALECHELVLANINYRRQRYTNDAAKYYITNYIYPTYAAAVKTAYQLYQLTGEEEYFDKCFQFMEASKASVLKEAVHENTLQHTGSIPKELLEGLEEVKVELAQAEKEQYDLKQSLEGDSLAVVELEGEIFELSRKKERLLADLGEYPEFFKLKQEENPLTPAQLRQVLKPEQAIVEYFIGEGEIYTYLLTRDTAVIHQQIKPTDFEKQVGNLQRSLNDWNFVLDSTDRATELYVESGYQLYQYLLAPVLNHLKAQNQVVIIPDGLLGYVPFETLLSHKPKGAKRFRNYPYLIKDYAFSYAYASTLWLENQLEGVAETEKGGYTFGGFAPIYPNSISSDYQADSLMNDGGFNPMFAMNVRGGLSDLVYAREIVDELAGLLNGQKWLAEAATKENFQKTAANYGVLHLAMHGIVDDQNPLYSHLVFTETEGKEDNRLTAAELYTMQLNAGLAVLSACNTGVGELKRGEGIMSLSRAFASAGCPSMVMSLWSVPDKQTGMLMENFYKELKAGESKDAALRQAKLTYLDAQDNQGAHPYLWAGFVVIGDTRSIQFDEGWMDWRWGLVVGLILAAMGFYFFKEKRA